MYIKVSTFITGTDCDDPSYRIHPYQTINHYHDLLLDDDACSFPNIDRLIKQNPDSCDLLTNFTHEVLLQHIMKKYNQSFLAALCHVFPLLPTSTSSFEENYWGVY